MSPRRRSFSRGPGSAAYVARKTENPPGREILHPWRTGGYSIKEEGQNEELDYYSDVLGERAKRGK
jgi:hypothetical protein